MLAWSDPVRNEGEWLRDLQEHVVKLESIHVDQSRIPTVRVDQGAKVSNRRIKSKRKLIVILALFRGFMLSVFAAFSIEFLAKARREQYSEVVEEKAGIN